MNYKTKTAEMSHVERREPLRFPDDVTGFDFLQAFRSMSSDNILRDPAHTRGLYLVIVRFKLRKAVKGRMRRCSIRQIRRISRESFNDSAFSEFRGGCSPTASELRPVPRFSDR